MLVGSQQRIANKLLYVSTGGTVLTLLNEPYLQLRHSIKMAQGWGYFIQRPLKGVVFPYQLLCTATRGKVKLTYLI